MKIETIELIHNLLKEKSHTATTLFKNYSKDMQKKYDTMWIENKMTEFEKSTYEDYRKIRGELSDALQDFEQHQW